MLLSGASSGEVAAWDVAFPDAPLAAWDAHGAGVLALRADAARGPGAFWSHGRDGWVHAWVCDSGGGYECAVDDGGAWGRRSASAATGDGRAAAPLDALDALLGGLRSSPTWARVKSASVRVGDGGFCALAVLHPLPGSLHSHAILAAPAAGSDGVALWSAGDTRVRCVVHVPEAAARAAAAAALEGTPAVEHDAESIVGDLGRRAGAPLCVALLRRADSLGCGGGGEKKWGEESVGGSRDERVDRIESAHVGTAVPLGGVRAHSHTPPPSGLRALLGATHLRSPAVGTVTDVSPPPPPPPPLPRFPTLVVAAYESGTLLVLDPPPPQRPDPLPPQRPDAADETGESRGDAWDFEATHGARGGDGEGETARVIITLHLARHPLLAFALQDGAADGTGGARDDSERSSSLVRGVATAAGAVVYVFELDVERQTGTVLRRLLLPAPGANSVASFGGAALVGAWVGAIVRVGFNDSGEDGVEWWGGDGGGVACVAASTRQSLWALGDKLGKVALWGCS